VKCFPVNREMAKENGVLVFSEKEEEKKFFA
jgi:hypothetical protein